MVYWVIGQLIRCPVQLSGVRWVLLAKEPQRKRGFAQASLRQLKMDLPCQASADEPPGIIAKCRLGVGQVLYWLIIRRGLSRSLPELLSRSADVLGVVASVIKTFLPFAD
jgi:hypothetical protein